jgi:hypothetical protein
MQVLVKSAEVISRTIKRARDGKSFTFREQQALVSLGDETRSVALSLTDDQAPYPAGRYEIAFDGSVYVDRNGRLALGRVALKPLQVAAK